MEAFVGLPSPFILNISKEEKAQDEDIIKIYPDLTP